MKIATWNVNSLKVRLPHLLDWLAATQTDVICLQETKTEDAKFPRAEIEAAGYQVAFSGQKTYNGVAILSRLPIEDAQAGIPGFEDEQKRVLATRVRHFPSGYPGISSKIYLKTMDYVFSWFLL